MFVRLGIEAMKKTYFDRDMHFLFGDKALPNDTL